MKQRNYPEAPSECCSKLASTFSEIIQVVNSSFITVDIMKSMPYLAVCKFLLIENILLKISHGATYYFVVKGKPTRRPVTQLFQPEKLRALCLDHDYMRVDPGEMYLAEKKVRIL